METHITRPRARPLAKSPTDSVGPCPHYGRTNGKVCTGKATGTSALDRFIRFKEVTERVRLSRTTIWRLEREGKFPARRKLSSRTVAWLESEIDEWIRTRALVAGAMSQ